MGKLTQEDVRHIIDLVEKGRSKHEIARRYGITPRWVRELWERSGRGQTVPIPGRPRRPRLELTEEDQELILDYFRKYRLDPIDLSIKIRVDHQFVIPKNVIWKVLKSGRVVKDNPAKQKQRKWVRWEREHTNSLWQTDFTQIGDEWLIAYLDDASHFITGWTLASTATAELAWKTFERAGEIYGYPRQLLSDNGSRALKLA